MLKIYDSLPKNNNSKKKISEFFKKIGKFALVVTNEAVKSLCNIYADIDINVLETFERLKKVCETNQKPEETSLTKEELRKLLKEIVKEKKLVIFVDELDRCKPTFAISVLERVKHLFNIENIVWVFSINKAQLIMNIRHFYGEIDAGQYLQRFFDFELQLPYKSAGFFEQIIE